MSGEQGIEHVRQLYERAVFGGDADALGIAERELDGVEADLALARGRVLHARFLEGGNDNPHELALFERAAQLYQELGDVRGEAESLFWIGCFHQVVRHDNDAAVPALERSYELATQAGDRLTMSYAVRHLGFADMAMEARSAARERLEESVRLRREIGFSPGVAAGLVALAYLTAGEGHRDDAMALVEEAGAVAEGCGARGVLSWVEEARTQL
jgi:hypothetical protein